MRQVVLATIAAIVFVSCSAVMGVGQEPKTPAAADAPVDFKQDIRPIFRRHCYRCHGPHKQEGGLRLDDREHAQLGGTSHVSVLGGSLATNPIYLRVTSADSDTRMPLKEEPLSANEIEKIARWVKQDTPWPASALPRPPSDSEKAKLEFEPGFLGWLAQISDKLDAAFHNYLYLKELAYLGLVLLGVALFVEVLRDARKKEKKWTLGKLRPFVSAMCALRVSHFVVLLLAVGIYKGWQDFRIKVDGLTAQRDKLQKGLLTATTTPPLENLYGSPPIPNRPSKLKELSGTYYRGNCERNALLFNGGNYRTATFHLGLVGADEKQVELGSMLKGTPLSIRFDIERAPKTAAEFFTKKTMDRIYLTEHTAKFPSSKPATSKPVCLQTIAADSRWGGLYPIGTVPEGEKATMSGLIYVVVGVPEQGTVVGQIHYGIKYDLVFENGKIVDGSDLWMSELLITTTIAPPRKDKVPLNEWFDYRPIPEITGENTKDPKLLGINSMTTGPDDPKSGK